MGLVPQRLPLQKELEQLVPKRVRVLPDTP